MRVSDFSRLLASLVLIIAISSCGKKPEAEDHLSPVIICHSELKDLLEQELKVFKELYPKSSLSVQYSNKVTLSRISGKNNVLGIISNELNDTVRYYIYRNRKFEIDSTAFVFQKKFRKNKFLLYKFYEFEPSNGVVQQFASFLCGPKGQLIAKKAGYLPVRPPERKIEVKDSFK